VRVPEGYAEEGELPRDERFVRKRDIGAGFWCGVVGVVGEDGDLAWRHGGVGSCEGYVAEEVAECCFDERVGMEFVA
jgi:hypothetical protein